MRNYEEELEIKEWYFKNTNIPIQCGSIDQLY
jgi:hypothetical protein